MPDCVSALFRCWCPAWFRLRFWGWPGSAASGQSLNCSNRRKGSKKVGSRPIPIKRSDSFAAVKSPFCCRRTFTQAIIGRKCMKMALWHILHASASMYQRMVRDNRILAIGLVPHIVFRQTVTHALRSEGFWLRAMSLTALYKAYQTQTVPFCAFRAISLSRCLAESETRRKTSA